MATEYILPSPAFSELAYRSDVEHDEPSEACNESIEHDETYDEPSERSSLVPFVFDADDVELEEPLEPEEAETFDENPIEIHATANAIREVLANPPQVFFKLFYEGNECADWVSALPLFEPAVVYTSPIPIHVNGADVYRLVSFLRGIPSYVYRIVAY
jgi:hypothetical protein